MCRRVLQAGGWPHPPAGPHAPRHPGLQRAVGPGELTSHTAGPRVTCVSRVRTTPANTSTSWPSTATTRGTATPDTPRSSRRSSTPTSPTGGGPEVGGAPRGWHTVCSVTCCRQAGHVDGVRSGHCGRSPHGAIHGLHGGVPGVCHLSPVLNVKDQVQVDAFKQEKALLGGTFSVIVKLHSSRRFVRGSSVQLDVATLHWYVLCRLS